MTTSRRRCLVAVFAALLAAGVGLAWWWTEHLKQAVAALGAIGPGAKEAVPALERLLADERQSVSKAANLALEKIRRE